MENLSTETVNNLPKNESTMLNVVYNYKFTIGIILVIVISIIIYYYMYKSKPASTGQPTNKKPLKYENFGENNNLEENFDLENNNLEENFEENNIEDNNSINLEDN